MNDGDAEWAVVGGGRLGLIPSRASLTEDGVALPRLAKRKLQLRGSSVREERSSAVCLIALQELVRHACSLR